MKTKQIILYSLTGLCLIITSVLLFSTLTFKKNQNKKIDDLNVQVQALQDDNSKLHKELDEANKNAKTLSEEIEKQKADIIALKEKDESLVDACEALGLALDSLYNDVIELEEEINELKNN